ncbi:hypothetical protein [Paracoccus aestuariivivens]|uniref:Uncharacterized protein n=1 Tax=Paracoccus aestuariivivens TaxID=1820333 RepID=A0A6L6J4H7_9RHOB|nr:hypothetical protein [Paracoccus aestuariivivens]MTH76780.1 hypothetical protein [Paracoccus aestuariivivens]
MKLAALLAILFIPLFQTPSAANSGSATPVELQCGPEGDASENRLCEALEYTLLRRGYKIQNNSQTKIRLVSKNGPDGSMRARLEISRDGSVSYGAEAELSVIDRNSIPERSINSFAASLLDRSGF